MIPMPSTSGATAIWRAGSKDSRSSQDAGVSRLFPPAGLDEELAQADVAHVVHRSPRLFDIDRSTWTLSAVRSVIDWIAHLSLGAVDKYLHRFRLCYKRGRQHVQSPDPLYDQKLAAIARARDLALQAPGDVVFLYVDEHTANLRPRVGRTFQPIGQKGEKATGAASTLIRLAGALDVATGQVIVRRRETFPVKEVYRFFYHVEYAPWTNPIEKFWLKLNREFMNQHPYERDEQAFRDALDLWLDKHREESAALLHEVGLLPDGWKVLPD
jgi:hypothetical protein